MTQPGAIYSFSPGARRSSVSYGNALSRAALAAVGSRSLPNICGRDSPAGVRAPRWVPYSSVRGLNRVGGHRCAGVHEGDVVDSI